MDYYGCAHNLRNKLTSSINIIDLEEVTATDVKAFLPYVLMDLDHKKEGLQESLQVFTMQQIIGYIETAVEKAILCIHTQSINVSKGKQL